MPGKPKRSRSASTSGVMTPRSSATIGSSPEGGLRSASKKAAPGPLHPPPVDRGLRVPRHLPVRLEAAEVVEPHEVDEREHGAEAVDPPGVAGARERVPAVERVAPELAGGAEVVGRDAGLEGRPAVGGEVEELRVRPDVGAVVGDEDRDVAHDADAALAGLPPDVRPLLEEEPLLELDLAHLARELASRPLERLRVAVHERAVPGAPGRPAVRVLEGHEQGEVVEPGRLLVREGLEGLAARRRRLLLEGGEGLRQERPLELDHRARSRPPAPGSRAAFFRSAAASRPSSRRRSSETSRGLPANAEKHWYGESP